MPETGPRKMNFPTFPRAGSMQTAKARRVTISIGELRTQVFWVNNMIDRIVEVAEDRRHLFCPAAFWWCRIPQGSQKLGQVPLDDVTAVIGNAHGLSYQQSAGCAGSVVFLSYYAQPIIMWRAWYGRLTAAPQQAKRFFSPDCRQPAPEKRLWAEIVKSNSGRRLPCLKP